MRWINVFYLICIFLCVSFSPEKATAQDKHVLLDQARQLYEEGNYFEAAITWERAYFFSSDPRKRIEANLGRAQALKQTGDFRMARNDLQRSVHLRQYPQLHARVLYELAFCEYMLGNFTASLGALQQLEHYYPRKSQTSEIMLLYSLAAIMNENWEVATEKTLARIQNLGLSAAATDSLMNKTLQVFCECSIPVTLSENRARNWSTFVPGAGQLYAGYPGRAMLNAGSQVASLGLAGYMAYSNLYVSGFVIGLGLFQSFYFGGIKQAGYLANQKNNIQMGAYKSDLKTFVIQLEEIQ